MQDVWIGGLTDCRIERLKRCPLRVIPSIHQSDNPSIRRSPSLFFGVGKNRRPWQAGLRYKPSLGWAKSRRPWEAGLRYRSSLGWRKATDLASRSALQVFFGIAVNCGPSTAFGHSSLTVSLRCMDWRIYGLPDCRIGRLERRSLQVIPSIHQSDNLFNPLHCSWGGSAGAGGGSELDPARGADVSLGSRLAWAAAGVATPGGNGWGPRPIFISDFESGKPVGANPCPCW